VRKIITKKTSNHRCSPFSLNILDYRHEWEIFQEF
jgi:hypothetical protein